MEEWLAITATRREWRCAMAYAVGHWKEAWPSWTEDAKEAAVRQLLSPFEVSPETIAAFRQDLRHQLVNWFNELSGDRDANNTTGTLTGRPLPRAEA